MTTTNKLVTAEQARELTGQGVIGEAFKAWTRSHPAEWNLAAMWDNGKFVQFTDPETDNAWLGFVAAYKLHTPALARTIIVLYEAIAAAEADQKAEFVATGGRQFGKTAAYRAGVAYGESKMKARADAAEARVAVRVKPLVWDAVSGIQTAQTPWVRYALGQRGGIWIWAWNGQDHPAKSEEAAKAAAQADYDARIRAALETGESTPVAWMGREGYFTTDPSQASAHAHHGTPLTPLYASAALETGAEDE